MNEFKGKRAWTHGNKSEWGPGPWDGEPDRVFWVHNGLVCMILRGPVGALCGYVGVPPGHPMFGLEDAALYDGPCAIDQPHGGITWTGELPGDEVSFLCDLAVGGQPLELASYWYFGFDCGHAGDVSPELHKLKRQRRNAGDNEVALALQKAGFDPRETADPMVTAGLEYAQSALFPSDTYKDIDYVLDEVSKLAVQIEGVEKNVREQTALRRRENVEDDCVGL
jgi:hypothetical protein